MLSSPFYVICRKVLLINFVLDAIILLSTAYTLFLFLDLSWEHLDDDFIFLSCIFHCKVFLSVICLQNTFSHSRAIVIKSHHLTDNLCCWWSSYFCFGEMIIITLFFLLCGYKCSFRTSYFFFYFSKAWLFQIKTLFAALFIRHLSFVYLFMYLIIFYRFTKTMVSTSIVFFVQCFICPPSESVHVENTQ